jgi:hypothetical protein
MSRHATAQVSTNAAPQAAARSTVLQRRCACGAAAGFSGECEACAERRLLPHVHGILRMPGAPLDAATRDVMETHLRHDFSRVRVHTDDAAALSARAVDARAYAVGNHIVFGAGEYRPSSPDGRRMLAHELVHTIQQEPATLPAADAPFVVAPPSDRHEQEADRVAHDIGAATARPPGPVRVSQAAPRGALQRTALAGAAIGAASGLVLGGAIGAAAGGPIGALIGLGIGALVGAGIGALIGHATAGPPLPTISIGNFRNTGATSAENTCVSCPRTLGVPAAAGQNTMELRGDIAGARPGIEYDFRRTKERTVWKKVAGAWSVVKHAPAGTPDDENNDDEYRTPVNNHIYVIDTPGFDIFTNPVPDARATEAVYKASFVEICNARDTFAAWTLRSNAFEWHSTTWLEKVGADWRRKAGAGANEIAPGRIPVGSGNP